MTDPNHPPSAGMVILQVLGYQGSSEAFLRVWQSQVDQLHVFLLDLAGSKPKKNIDWL